MRAAFTRKGEYAAAMAGSSERYIESPYLRRLPPVKITRGEEASTGRAGMVPGGGVSAALDRGEEACGVAEGAGGAAARCTNSDTTGREMSSTAIGTAIAEGKAGGAAGRGD